MLWHNGASRRALFIIFSCCFLFIPISSLNFTDSAVVLFQSYLSIFVPRGFCVTSHALCYVLIWKQIWVTEPSWLTHCMTSIIKLLRQNKYYGFYIFRWYTKPNKNNHSIFVSKLSRLRLRSKLTSLHCSRIRIWKSPCMIITGACIHNEQPIYLICLAAWLFN